MVNLEWGVVFSRTLFHIRYSLQQNVSPNEYSPLPCLELDTPDTYWLLIVASPI